MTYANELKSLITMSDVCGMYGIPVNRAGFACCPLHGEKTPSMKIYPGNRGWHCFGCNQGGSILDFVMAYQGVDLPTAMRTLNDAFHIGLPLDEKQSDQERSDQERQARLRRQERERREKEHQRLQNAYDTALTRWAAMDKTLMEKAPEGPLDAPDEVWVYAMQHIDQAENELVRAEEALRQYEARGA